MPNDRERHPRAAVWPASHWPNSHRTLSRPSGHILPEPITLSACGLLRPASAFCPVQTCPLAHPERSFAYALCLRSHLPLSVPSHQPYFFAACFSFIPSQNGNCFDQEALPLRLSPWLQSTLSMAGAGHRSRIAEPCLSLSSVFSQYILYLPLSAHIRISPALPPLIASEHCGGCARRHPARALPADKSPPAVSQQGSGLFIRGPAPDFPLPSDATFPNAGNAREKHMPRVPISQSLRRPIVLPRISDHSVLSTVPSDLRRVYHFPLLSLAPNALLRIRFPRPCPTRCQRPRTSRPTSTFVAYNTAPLDGSGPRVRIPAAVHPSPVVIAFPIFYAATLASYYIAPSPTISIIANPGHLNMSPPESVHDTACLMSPITQLTQPSASRDFCFLIARWNRYHRRSLVHARP